MIFKSKKNFFFKKLRIFILFYRENAAKEKNIKKGNFPG